MTTQASPLPTLTTAPVCKSPNGEDHLQITTVANVDGIHLARIESSERALITHGQRPIAAAAVAGETAIVAPDTPATEATIRQAIADLCSWVKRAHDHRGGYETVPSWSPRAVVAALRQLLGSGQ